MADRLIGTVCMALVAVAACSCGPDEAAAQSPARKAVAEIGALPLMASREPPEAVPAQAVPPEAVEPLPQPALITVVLTDLPATVPTVPESSSGPQPGIADLSHRIENVMSALERLVAESIRMQDSLLRLRLSPKRPEPDDAAAGSS